MKKPTLREKDIQILNLIVENYLKVGKPISSGHISQRIDFELASSVLNKKGLLNERYFDEVCDCQVCKQILAPVPDETKFYEYGKYMLSSTGKSEVPTEDTLKNNQLHYLLKRFSDIKKINPPDQKKKYREFIDWNKRMKIVSTQHLENWLKVLDEREES